MWYMPFAGAAAGIGSSAAGLAMSAVKDSTMQKKQYRYNLELQREAQRWQEYMSSTAHQRQVNDLRKAGLNPILSATGGAGAPFSNASGGSVSAPSSSASGGITEGISSAAQFVNAEANLKNSTSTAKLNQALVDTQKTQQALNVAKTQETIARSNEISAGLPFERFVTNSAKKFQSFVSDVTNRFINPVDFVRPVHRTSSNFDIMNKKITRQLFRQLTPYRPRLPPIAVPYGPYKYHVQSRKKVNLK